METLVTCNILLENLDIKICVSVPGPLCYFDSHLVWLRDDRYAVIGDMRGHNSAVLSGMSLSGLNMVTVMDHALHHLPSKRKCLFLGFTTNTLNCIFQFINF